MSQQTVSHQILYENLLLEECNTYKEYVACLVNCLCHIKRRWIASFSGKMTHFQTVWRKKYLSSSVDPIQSQPTFCIGPFLLRNKVIKVYFPVTTSSSDKIRLHGFTISEGMSLHLIFDYNSTRWLRTVLSLTILLVYDTFQF